MGIPTSALFAEVFLQWFEHMFIVKILLEHRIVDCYRHVDDILILYDPDVTYVDQVLTDFNRLHTSLTLTMENEINSSINFLDLTICNINGILECKIYKTYMTTHLNIHNDLCHPFEHKISAI
jgi:hypothetical protein